MKKITPQQVFEEIEQLMEIANGFSDQGIIANIRGMMERKDRTEGLKSGVFRKMIVQGELDTVISIDDAEKMAALNSNIQLEIVENVTTPALYGGFGHEGNRDSREGEDLFLRRHDFDGNILPGSTWAHFDESRSDEHAYYQVRPDGAFPNPGTVVTAPT
jgi:hypothetical protein